VERAVDGDVRAFEVLVRRHGPLIRTYVMRILGTKSEVDDVDQETFITAWAKLPILENSAVVRIRRRRGSFVGATRIKSVLA
jgi:RNA polymerase sigma-70 factor (ECF subfamily)